MYHLYNPDASPELSIYLFSDFSAKLKYSETFLSSDCEVWLILVETYMDYLLFLLIHFCYPISMYLYINIYIYGILIIIVIYLLQKEDIRLDRYIYAKLRK